MSDPVVGGHIVNVINRISVQVKAANLIKMLEYEKDTGTQVALRNQFYKILDII